MFNQDKDAFDPKLVREADEERRRQEGDRRPDGSHGLRCGCCGRALDATAITGCCCYHCGQTLR